MKTNQSNVDSVLRTELLDMAMEQLRILKDVKVTDRNFANTVTKADSVFNGVGKVIKIAALEALHRASEGEGERLSTKVKMVGKEGDVIAEIEQKSKEPYKFSPR